jgi:predicted membrane protein
MSKYYKGKYLILKVIGTLIVLSSLLLTQYGLISNKLNAIFIIVTLITYFVIDHNMRKNAHIN